MSTGALSPSEEVLLPDEQPVQREGACMNCGRERDTWPLDVVVPDDQWRQLTGRDDGRGILCLDCMLARAARLPGVTMAKLTFAAKYESRRERREREREELKARKAASITNQPRKETP